MSFDEPESSPTIRTDNRSFWVTITIMAIVSLVIFALLLTLSYSEDYAVGTGEGTQAEHTHRDGKPATQADRLKASGPIATKYMNLAESKGWELEKDYVPTQPDEVRTLLESIPRLPVENGQSLGKIDAPVRVMIFSDYACRFCQKFHNEGFAVLEKLAQSGKVYVEHYHYPIFATSNSGQASRAAYAAAQQGKFWEYSDALYAEATTQQNAHDKVEFTQQILTNIATKLNLNIDQFMNDAASEQAGNYIDGQAALAGQQLGINSTPAIIINGTYLPGAFPAKIIENTVELESEIAAH